MRTSSRSCMTSTLTLPGILWRVYTQGLDAKALVVPLESVGGKGCGERTISPAEYWQLLLQNKRSRHGTGLKEVVGRRASDDPLSTATDYFSLLLSTFYLLLLIIERVDVQRLSRLRNLYFRCNRSWRIARAAAAEPRHHRDILLAVHAVGDRESLRGGSQPRLP